VTATVDTSNPQEASKRAQILRQSLKNRGAWSGGIVPHVEYQTKPLEWIVEKLGVPEETLRWSLSPEYASHVWDGDADPLVRILEGLAEWKDVGVESGTGTGKTFLAACITLWFLAAHKDAIVSTVAPVEHQLLKHVWKEIGKLFPQFKVHFPNAELLSGLLRMVPVEGDKERWAASAFVCGVGASEEVATKAQGLHAEHLLIITEETPGIDPAIMKALYNTRTDDHNLHLALGNPDHQEDALHRFCMDDADVHVIVSALDHPNVVTGRRVVPGAIGRKRLTKRIEKHPEGTRMYQSRVRGISPAESEDALIRWDWCVMAAKKYDDPLYRQGPLALGVDVADTPQGDPAAIARWQGACLTEVKAKNVRDATEVADWVRVDVRRRDHPVDPRYIGIDSVGVGASTVNELRKLGIKVRKLAGGRKAIPALDENALWSTVTEPDFEGKVKPAGPKLIEAEEYDNLRSQIWWRMREDLRLGQIALPYDEELFRDLCAPSYKTPNKIVVESKRDIIKRLHRSPNKGDAACYGNFVRKRTPTRRQLVAQDVAVAGPNVDTILERRLAVRARREAAKEKRIRRMLKRQSKRYR